MDTPDDGFAMGYSSLRPASEDPPGWIDGAPTSRRGQSCAFCTSSDVAWVHPLGGDLVQYEVYGKGHTLPTFWALCDRCEEVYASDDAEAALAVMLSGGWSWVAAEDVAECLRKPLNVFRRADKGARRLDG